MVPGAIHRPVQYLTPQPLKSITKDGDRDGTRNHNNERRKQTEALHPSPPLLHVRLRKLGTLPRVTWRVQSQAQMPWQSLVPSVLPALLPVDIYGIQTLED